MRPKPLPPPRPSASRGIFIPAIRYPTVARGQARLRLTLTAAHTPADLAQLLTALHSLDFRL